MIEEEFIKILDTIENIKPLSNDFNYRINALKILIENHKQSKPLEKNKETLKMAKKVNRLLRENCEWYGYDIEDFNAEEKSLLSQLCETHRFNNDMRKYAFNVFSWNIDEPLMYKILKYLNTKLPILYTKTEAIEKFGNNAVSKCGFYFLRNNHRYYNAPQVRLYIPFVIEYFNNDIDELSEEHQNMFLNNIKPSTLLNASNIEKHEEYILTDVDACLEYIDTHLKHSWDDFETKFKNIDTFQYNKHKTQLLKYIKNYKKDRWTELEPYIFNDFELYTHYLNIVNTPEVNNAYQKFHNKKLASNNSYRVTYAISHNIRIIEHESKILNSKLALEYSLKLNYFWKDLADILHDLNTIQYVEYMLNFKQLDDRLEPAILKLKNINYASKYMKLFGYNEIFKKLYSNKMLDIVYFSQNHLNERWLEKEKKLFKQPDILASYIINVVKYRIPEYEPILKLTYKASSMYLTFCKKNNISLEDSCFNDYQFKCDLEDYRMSKTKVKDAIDDKQLKQIYSALKSKKDLLTIGKL